MNSTSSRGTEPDKDALDALLGIAESIGSLLLSSIERIEKSGKGTPRNATFEEVLERKSE